jgi:prepilin-type N-terminal cleavage/methylation domain-containing protein/prepilin-type processing-associated H-X9-DG protein
MDENPREIPLLAQEGSARAFTIVELLTVMAIIVVLASLLLPSLSAVRARSQAAVCANNKKQLTLGWIMYSDENRGRLVPNFGNDRVHATAVRNWNDNWVNNRMTWELDSGNTNRSFTDAAKLTAYTGQALPLYTCPADHVLSAIQRRAGWNGRVRSISMNGMAGDPGPSLKDGFNVNNPEYVQFLNMAAIPHPSGIFVLLDEHPDSINDGYFLNVGDSDEWVDLPGSYHNGAGTFSFADGHSEVHPWRYAHTKQPSQPDGARLPFSIPSAETGDFDWLMDKTSIER